MNDKSSPQVINYNESGLENLFTSTKKAANIKSTDSKKSKGSKSKEKNKSKLSTQPLPIESSNDENTNQHESAKKNIIFLITKDENKKEGKNKKKKEEVVEEPNFVNDLNFLVEDKKEAKKKNKKGVDDDSSTDLTEVTEDNKKEAKKRKKKEAEITQAPDVEMTEISGSKKIGENNDEIITKQKRKKKKEGTESELEEDTKNIEIKTKPKKKYDKVFSVKKVENPENQLKSLEDEIIGKLKISDEGQVEVLKYMIKMNRPFSITNIGDNMHWKYKKKNLSNILTSLVEKNYLKMKKFNQEIYLINQDLFPQTDNQMLNELNNELVFVENILNTTKEVNHKLNQELKIYIQANTKQQLDKLIKEQTEAKIQKENKVNSFKMNESITEEQMLKKIKEYELNFKKVRRLKKTLSNVVSTLSDAFELKTDEFMETYSIEDITDFMEMLNKKL